MKKNQYYLNKSLNQPFEILKSQNTKRKKSSSKTDSFPKKNYNPTNLKIQKFIFDTKQSIKNNTYLCEMIQSHHNSGQPQKCLEHNNYYSLFCQKQKQLLCINCVYGKSTHNSHRVIPIKNAEKQISLQNQNLGNKLKRKYDFFEQMISICHSNKQLLDRHYQINVFEIKKQIEHLINMLKKKEQELQFELKREYEGAERFNNQIINSYTSINNLFKSQISKIGKRILPDQQIYRNRLLNSILKDMDQISINVDPEEKLLKSYPNYRQFKKVQKIIEQLKLGKDIQQFPLYYRGNVQYPSTRQIANYVQGSRLLQLI